MGKSSLFTRGARFQSLAFLFLLVCISFPRLPVVAHEFWLEPDIYHPMPSEKVSIRIRVGQFFKGPTFPYLKDSFNVFDQLQGGKSSPVRGVDGDDPAATLAFVKTGLGVITLHNKPVSLTFDEWEKFNAYLEKEGLKAIPQRHLQAGKPKSGIKEFYARAAKLLLNVGGQGAGEDQYTGMPLELVAELNPYCLGPEEKLPVQLLFKGKPLGDIQITAISKLYPETREIYRTDKTGRALIALNNDGPWLLNAVHMLEPRQGMDAHWFSLWASLVFMRSEANQPRSKCPP